MMKYFLPQVCLLIIGLGLSLQIQAQWYQYQWQVMGTSAKLELWADSKQSALLAKSAVHQELYRIEQLMSPYIESSELSKINQLAARQAVVVSDELYSILEKSLYFSTLTEGAFDISFASVGHLYQYPKAIAPTDAVIDVQRSKINYRYIQLEPTNRSVTFKEPGVLIDLGGIAKGYAVDRAILQLKKLGIKAALVAAGGDTRIIGRRGEYPWMIAIQDPRDKQKAIIRLPLVDVAVSTSGDYERYFIRDGERIHHIINPGTGRSISSVRSVTIIADQSITSDALSTSVFVLGVKQGLALVNSLSSIDAIIIDDKGLLHYSDGLLMPSIESQ